MPRDATGPKRSRTQSLYDRIADIHNLAMKVNGYQRSIASYLRSKDLGIGSETLVLDAGSGTGIVTLAVQDAGFDPKCIVSLDLSANSLGILQDEIRKRRDHGLRVAAVQGNILTLPFPDGTFDVILMCGVLEYAPLEAGLGEAARVLKHGARLVLLPVKPSVVGSVLEVLYNFKTHRPEDVRSAAARYFDLVGIDKFPITQPIAWSKMIFIFERK